ncbi:hypothetical protein CTAYLR_007494, partial [Chrysophaeum taylorii]
MEQNSCYKETSSQRRRRSDLFGSFVGGKQQPTATFQTVYIAAASFFVAGVLEDAIDYTHREHNKFEDLMILIAHTIAVHLLCAVGCTYIHTHPGLSEDVSKKLRTPLAVLTGWMWKAVAGDLSNILIFSAPHTKWERCIFAYLYAIGVSIVAVTVAVHTSKIVPRSDDNVFWCTIKYVGALVGSSLVLPIAFIWDIAINYTVRAYCPEDLQKDMSIHLIMALRAMAIHLMLTTTAQSILNRRRRRAVPVIPDTRPRRLFRQNTFLTSARLMQEKRRVLEDKTLMYITAWGWWQVPVAIYSETPALTLNAKTAALVVIVACYFNACIFKTIREVSKPENAQGYVHTFFALTCASFDPQLGWAIVAAYTETVVDYNRPTAVKSILWIGVVVCILALFITLKVAANWRPLNRDKSDDGVHRADCDVVEKGTQVEVTFVKLQPSALNLTLPPEEDDVDVLEEDTKDEDVDGKGDDDHVKVDVDERVPELSSFARITTWVLDVSRLRWTEDANTAPNSSPASTSSSSSFGKKSKSSKGKKKKVRMLERKENAPKFEPIEPICQEHSEFE